MKFTIHNVENQLTKEEVERYREAGLNIENSTGTLFGKTSTYTQVKPTEKEFNTLEELMSFIKTIQCSIVIHEDNTIAVYDDYLE